MNDIFKEQVGPQTTILDQLNNVLKFTNEKKLEDLYHFMISDKSVLKAGYRPTLLQFREYLGYVKKGFEYDKDTYGNGTLPREISIRKGIRKIGNFKDTDWISYLPREDRIDVSLLHIAGQCVYYNNPRAIFEDSHLPKGFGVRGEDYTVLQAIEEGYHRYQLNVLGMKPERTVHDRSHPLEQGIIPVFQKAILDLGIQT